MRLSHHIGGHGRIRTPDKAFTGGTSGTFDPTQVAGLTAWFKADAGTSTTTDGAAISQWNDQSAGAHNAVQATGANQPLYKAAIQNGLPGVLFDGSNDFMDAAGINVSQPDTIIVAVRSLITTSGHNVFDGITQPSGRQSIECGANATTNWGMFASADAASTTATNTSAHVLAAIFNAASSQLFLDGAALTLGGSPGPNPLTGLRIGTFVSGAGQWNGYIFEILVYSGALSATDRQSVESYLKAKWGTP